MAMLERMVDPSAPTSAAGPASTREKRLKLTAGNGRGGDSARGGIGGVADARNLLNRLERKVRKRAAVRAGRVIGVGSD